MKHAIENKSEDKARRIKLSFPKAKLKQAVFLVFLAAFIVSSVIVIGDLRENKKAADIYSEIQLYARQEEMMTAEKAHKDEKPAPAAETPSQAADEREELPVISMDFAPLKKINPDVVGWIRGEGTNIDYPMVRTDNNDYYLDHLYDRTANDHGAIFLDYRCMDDFSDPNTVIYGHHMGNGTMFATLREYRFQDFYDANPTMEIYTPYGDYTVELICGTIESGDNEFVSFDFDSDEELREYVEGFRKNSTFKSEVELQPGDRIVSLCTCSYEMINARYMVIGRLVPVVE